LIFFKVAELNFLGFFISFIVLPQAIAFQAVLPAKPNPLIHFHKTFLALFTNFVFLAAFLAHIFGAFFAIGITFIVLPQAIAFQAVLPAKANPLIHFHKTFLALFTKFVFLAHIFGAFFAIGITFIVFFIAFFIMFFLLI